MDNFDHLEDTDLDALCQELGIFDEPEPVAPVAQGRASARPLNPYPASGGSLLESGFSFNHFANKTRERTPQEIKAQISAKLRRRARIEAMTPQELEEARALGRQRFHSQTPEQRRRKNRSMVASNRRRNARMAALEKELAQKPVSALTPDEVELLQKRAKFRAERAAYQRSRYVPVAERSEAEIEKFRARQLERKAKLTEEQKEAQRAYHRARYQAKKALKLNSKKG